MVAVAVMHLEGHPSDPAGGAGVAMESEARRRGSPARGDRVVAAARRACGLGVPIAAMWRGSEPSVPPAPTPVCC